MFNPTMARIAIVSVIAHAMAQAEVGIIDTTPEAVLENCLTEIEKYGFDSPIVQRIGGDARNQYQDDVPSMELMLQRQADLTAGIMVSTIETKTHGGSSLSWEALLMGPCMKLQEALGIEIGKIN